MKNLFALRTSHFALRTSHFALRTSLSALRSPLSALRSPLSATLRRIGLATILISLFYFSSHAQAPEAYWTFESNPCADVMTNWPLSSAPGDPDSLAAIPSGGMVDGYLDLDKITIGSNYYSRDSTNSGTFLTPNDGVNLSVEFLFKLSPDFHDANVINWTNRFAFHICDMEMQAEVILASGFKNLQIEFDGIGKKSFSYYSDGNWHHIAVTFSAATGVLTLYVDGTSPQGFQNPGSGGTNPIAAGNAIDFTPPFNKLLGGCIDEVAVYDAILSPYMVWHHYQNAINGQHYDYLISPNSPSITSTIFEPENTDPGDDLNTFDFGPGYQNVSKTPYELLRSYPGVRMKPDTSFPRITGFFGDWENLYDNAGNQWADSIQRELALRYHYNMSLAGEGYYRDPMFYLNANHLGKILIDLACTPPFDMIERSLVTHWHEAWDKVTNNSGQQITGVPYLTRTDMYQIKDPSKDKYYLKMHCQNAPFWYNTNFYSPAAPQDSLVRDGGEIWEMAKNAMNYMSILGAAPGIEVISENGEVFDGFSWSGDTNDPNVATCDTHVKNDKAAYLPASNIQGYLNTRVRDFALSYLSGFRDSINSVNSANGKDSLDFRWYKNSGRIIGLTDYNYFDTINSTDQGIRRHSPEFYPQIPISWRHSLSSITSVSTLGESIYGASAKGDFIFNPFISPGFYKGSPLANYDDSLLFRPGQWLGLLKNIGCMGADTYTQFMEYGAAGQPWPGNWRIWQTAMPAYAQAVSSRAGELLHNGILLNQFPILSPASSLCGGVFIWYAMKSGNLNHFINARKSNSAQKWLITGSVQKLSNAASHGEKVTETGIKLNGDSLHFPIRQQGSSYIYEISGSDTLFYQLDGWHEWKDPYWWCRDFVLEAELNDSISAGLAIKTDRKPGAVSGDFTGCISYLHQNGGSGGSNKRATWRFICRDQSQKTLYPWIRARINPACSNSSVTVGMKVDATPSWPASNNFQIVNDTSWKWYPLVNGGGSQDSIISLTLHNEHSIHLITENKCLDIDKIVLFRKPGNHFVEPLNAVITANPNPVCAGLPIQFDMDNSTFWGSCTDWVWNFGDGFLSYESSPSHVFINGGTYNVKLTISQEMAGTSDTDTLQMIIHSPSLDAGVDGYICSGDTGQLHGKVDTTNCIWGWKWDLQLSDTTILDPLTTVNTPHTFHLWAYDTVTGCGATDDVSVHLIQPNMRDTTYYLCDRSDSVTLAISGAYGVQPLDTSGLTPPSPLTDPFWKAGNFSNDTTSWQFKGWDALGCDTDIVEVKVILLKNFITSGDALICPGTPVQITTSFDTTLKFAWLVTYNLDLPGTRNPIATPEDSTTYILKVTDKVMQKSCYDSVTVDVHRAPVVRAGACYGDIATIKADGNAVSVLWQPGKLVKDSTAFLTGSTFPVIDTSYFTVYSYTTDSNGCSFIQKVYIEISDSCCWYPGTDTAWVLNNKKASYVIDSLNGGSNVVSGKTISINGLLEIDTNIRFHDCDIYIGMNGRIEYNDSLHRRFQIDSSLVTACRDTMWDGIYCDFSSPFDGKFIFFDNRDTMGEMSHSLNGINISGSSGTDLHAVFGNDFIDNNLSLHYSNSWLSSNAMFSGPSRARDNFFDSDTSSMKFPHKGQWADVGIRMESTVADSPALSYAGGDHILDLNTFSHLDTGMIISDSSSVFLSMNKFTEGGIGIVLDRSYLHSENNEFKWMKAGIIVKNQAILRCFRTKFWDFIQSLGNLHPAAVGIYGIENPGLQASEKIRITVSDQSNYPSIPTFIPPTIPNSLYLNGNYFRDVKQGIYTLNNAQLEVKNNHFDTIYSNAIYVCNSIDQVIRISGNRITDAWTGVRLAVTDKSYMEIDSNVITGDIAPGYNLQYGIKVLHAWPGLTSFKKPGFIKIINNQINLRGTGIHCSQVWKLRVENNAVSIHPNLSGSVVGIKSEFCDSSLFFYNQVYAVNLEPVQNTKGILMTQNHGSVLSCNEIYTFSEGIVFHADGWHTKIWDNTVTRADTGMRFINDGIVGQQGSGVSAIAAKNNWYQFHPDSTSQVMVTATHTDGTKNPNFVSNDTISNPEDSVYYDMLGLNTKNRVVGGALSKKTPFSIVTDNISNECPESALDLDHSGLGGTTKLFELLVRDSVEFNYWTTQMPHYRDVFANSFLLNDEDLLHSDSLYLNFFEVLEETNIGNIVAVWQALSEGDLDSAEFFNDYTPDNELEENLRDANIQLFRMLETGPGSILPADSTWLDSLARKCAVEYGFGVYTARALMGVLNPGFDFEDPCLASENPGGKRLIPESGKIAAPEKYHMKVFPNPAEGDFTIAGNSPGGILEVSGMDGKFSKSGWVDPGIFQISLSSDNLTKGVYVIRIRNLQGFSLYAKLVKI